MLGISACLGGIFCRYDGGTQTVNQFLTWVNEGKALLICPEVLGGLPTPRTPAEIQNGDGFDVWQNTATVLTQDGVDVTENYKQGAMKAYEAMKELGITSVILKERSPSCGSQMIYDGSFSGIKQAGVGVATAYFIQQGLKVYSEENWQEMEDL
ncbi:DUF523 domain-containing protein [Enterococcus sp. 2201sp1_2201st1_B8_2201SCRN_220225]|uniref:DUF523 domain-containing protein n=1 Tax=unclassified Enterococcus TaxID=2608891 RepID=UPI0034A3C80C